MHQPLTSKNFQKVKICPGAKPWPSKKARVRMQVVRNLRINLISIKEDLQRIDPQKNPQGYKKLRSKLEATLKGHKTVFSNMPDTNTP